MGAYYFILFDRGLYCFQNDIFSQKGTKKEGILKTPSCEEINLHPSQDFVSIYRTMIFDPKG